MLNEPIAEITPLPLAERGRVLTSATKWAENGLFLFQFLLFMALAFTPAVLGGLAATRHLFPGNRALSFSPVLVGFGLSGLLSWFLGGRILRKPWSADYMFRKAQRVVQERPEAIVDLNNEEAIFLEIIPRRNWTSIALQNAEDLGFLYLDKQGRRLLIEGDNKRYRIPVATVISSEVELMNPEAADDKQATPIGLVVLKVRDRLGERELPLRPVRTVGGDAMGGNYIERARELERRIAGVWSGLGVEQAVGS
jgi:hypothetical protein